MDKFTIAKNVDDAWQAVDAFPLMPGDPRYTDCSNVRGKTRDRIFRYLNRHSMANQNLHLLFTGYRGNGKTTELYQLQRELENDYEVLFFDAVKELDINNLTLSDLLLAIAKSTYDGMENVGYHLPHKLLKEVGDWFFTKVLEKLKISSAEIGAEGKISSPIWFSTVMAKVFSVVKMNTNEREIMRRELERDITELIKKVNALLIAARDKIRSKKKKDILFIIDSLDRLRQGLEKNLFIYDGELLKQLQGNFIYVVPISLLYNEQATLLPFDEQVCLPMIPIYQQGITRKKNVSSMALLHEMIDKRLDVNEIFVNPEESVEELILCSGGHLRDLMKLISYACSLTDEKIALSKVNAAINMLARDYEKVIRDEEYAHVLVAYQTQNPPNNEVNHKLIYNNVILVYRESDETEWKDVHPAVVRNSKFQKALQGE